jgi:hypothetical protein
MPPAARTAVSAIRAIELVCGPATRAAHDKTHRLNRGFVAASNQDVRDERKAGVRATEHEGASFGICGCHQATTKPVSAVVFLNRKTPGRPTFHETGQPLPTETFGMGTETFGMERWLRRRRLRDVVGVRSGAAPLRGSASARSPPRYFAALLVPRDPRPDSEWRRTTRRHAGEASFREPGSAEGRVLCLSGTTAERLTPRGKIASPGTS